MPLHPGTDKITIPCKYPVMDGAGSFKTGSGNSAVLLIHGWTSTPREMRYLAERLSNNFFCRGVRLKGHGTSIEELADSDWNIHLQQLLEEREALGKIYSEVYIIGLSYGALLAMHLAARKKTAGLVLLAPFLKTAGSFLRVVSDSVLVPFIPPFFKSIKKSTVSPIFNTVESDKHLCYQDMPVKPLKSVLDCSREAMKLAPSLSCPALIIHSVLDRTADYYGGLGLFRTLGAEDKKMITLKDSNHIITLDNERKVVEWEVQKWLERH